MATWPYTTQRWQRLRRHKLRQHPLCEACLQTGRIEPAVAVDHRVRIKDGGEPFPALDQLASLCARCHNTKTRAEQMGETSWLTKGCDVRGYPLDRNHPWYKT
jgi:5-methylcytosine-specific restriction enzyme A